MRKTTFSLVTILQTVILDPVAMVLLGALTWKKIVHTYQVNAHSNR